MAGWLAAGCLADTLCLNVMSSSRLQNVFVKFGFLTGRLGPHDPHTQDFGFHGVIFVKFRGLWTHGLPSVEPLVVKIITGVGYPFRRPVVVILGVWLPLWVVGCLLLFCFCAWFSKAESGMILKLFNSLKKW